MWRLVHNRSSSVQTYRSFNRLIINHLKDFILDDIQTINFLPSRLYYYSVQIAITEKASSRFNCEQSLPFLLRHFRMRARAIGEGGGARGKAAINEGEPQSLLLFCLRLGFRFVAHQSSLVCNSWSKTVGAVRTQIQKLASVTYNFCNK